MVALETTLVAHGFPAPEGVEVGLESERRVRAAGAVPATIGVLDGEIRIGLTEPELERFTPAARKAGPRDLAAAPCRARSGATTVGGTLAAARTAGIRFLGTGGLGGVHRGFPVPTGRFGRPRRGRTDAGARRLLGRQVAARRARNGRGAGDARRAGTRLARRHVAALLRRRRRAPGLGARRVRRGGRTRRQRALGARRRRLAARPTARREPRRGRSDRGGRCGGAVARRSRARR